VVQILHHTRAYSSESSRSTDAAGTSSNEIPTRAGHDEIPETHFTPREHRR